MLPQKFHDIVASCITPLQLDTCRKFADYLWGSYEQQRTLAEAIIQQRQAQLDREEGHLTDAEKLRRTQLMNAAPEGRHYSPAPGADASLHTMD